MGGDSRRSRCPLVRELRHEEEEPHQEAGEGDADHRGMGVDAEEGLDEEGAEQGTGGVAGMKDIHRTGAHDRVGADEDGAVCDGAAFREANAEKGESQEAEDAGEGAEQVAEEVTDGKEQHGFLRADLRREDAREEGSDDIACGHDREERAGRREAEIISVAENRHDDATRDGADAGEEEEDEAGVPERRAFLGDSGHGCLLAEIYSMLRMVKSLEEMDFETVYKEEL